MEYPYTADNIWRTVVNRVMCDGTPVAPRGMLTREIQGLSAQVSMLHPVIVNPLRKLNYRFMAAEALWIISGDNAVDGIVPYNKNLAPFSDDGIIFNGAYGPKIAEQLDFVLWSLERDVDTRQAVITIWRPNGVCGACGQSRAWHHPPNALKLFSETGVPINTHEFVITKDVPCTVSLTFQTRTRYGQLWLDTHAYMRSSDLWLGWPYDVFNFSIVTAHVASQLKERPKLGMLHWYAASAHLYQPQWAKAWECAEWYLTNVAPTHMVPRQLSQDHDYLVASLDWSRNNKARVKHEALWTVDPYAEVKS